MIWWPLVLIGATLLALMAVLLVCGAHTDDPIGDVNPDHLPLDYVREKRTR